MKSTMNGPLSKRASVSVSASVAAGVGKYTTGERLMEFSTGRGLSFGIRQSGGERDMFISIRGLRRSVSLPVGELEALKKLLQVAIGG